MAQVFSSKIAALYGVDEAVLIHVLYTLEQRGKRWLDFSKGDARKYFSYWTERELYELLEAMEQRGLLVHHPDEGAYSYGLDTPSREQCREVYRPASLRPR